jgi:hypothetical protein
VLDTTADNEIVGLEVTGKTPLIEERLLPLLCGMKGRYGAYRLAPKDQLERV